MEYTCRTCGKDIEEKDLWIDSQDNNYCNVCMFWLPAKFDTIAAGISTSIFHKVRYLKEEVKHLRNALEVIENGHGFIDNDPVARTAQNITAGYFQGIAISALGRRKKD